jgi:branched-chain amino acid transport system substrate-binding protein
MQKWLRLLPAAISIAGLLIAGGLSAQEAPASIKVGYVLSLTGPQADGALLTTAPNYRLWVDDVNKAGGLMLKKYGKRIPIEVREIDDRSDNVEMVRHVERLMRDHICEGRNVDRIGKAIRIASRTISMSTKGRTPRRLPAD